MKSDSESTKIRRIASGGIDMHYYMQKAHEERSRALREIGSMFLKRVHAVMVKRQITMITDCKIKVNQREVRTGKVDNSSG